MGLHYEIRIKGHLDQVWSEWLGALTIIHQGNGETLITGLIADQAALHGVLNQIRNIGVALISVNPVMISPESNERNADEKP